MPARISEANQNTLLDVWKRYMVLAKDIGALIPKVHLVVHMIFQMSFLGNPTRYHTFLSESCNSILKRVLRGCHQRTFEETAVVKLGEALARSHLRRRFPKQ